MPRGWMEAIAISQKGPFPFGKVRQTFAKAVLLPRVGTDQPCAPKRGCACKGATQSGAPHRNGNDVFDAAFGLDDVTRTGIALELAAQAQDLRINAAVKCVFRRFDKR